MNGERERLHNAAEQMADSRLESSRSNTPAGFLAQLRAAPAPRSPRERAIFWSAFIAIALSRVFARSATLWDWDEALFSTAVREYDVAAHHPHPPGFPLYIIAARLVRFLTSSDFRALQLITIIGAIALFPLLVGFARELRLSFVTSMLGAVLFSFFPNVWFYGGTAFSDISATAMAIGACVLLLRGARNRRDYFLGALMLGVATGFRSQSLVIGCAPALAATAARLTDRDAGPVTRRVRDLFVASLIGASVIALSYGGAAWASADPPRGFLNACAGVREWVRTVDSYLNPGRPPLRDLWREFFVRPMRAGRIDVVVFVLALIGAGAGLWRRKAGILIALLTFLPFMVLAWLMLDFTSIARYSVAYISLHALLAAEGAGVVGRLLPRPRRGLPSLWQAVIVIAISADYAAWTLPAVSEARQPAPTEAAMRWIFDHTAPGAAVVVAGNMAPFADCDLTSRAVIVVDPEHLPVIPDSASVWYVTEGGDFSTRRRTFARPRKRLWQLARQRYFEVSIGPASDLAVFGPGWYWPEGDQVNRWRWMGRRGVIFLQPIAGHARLAMSFSPPSQVIGRATMTIRFNGVVVDRVLLSGESVDRSLELEPRSGMFNEVEITTDRVVNPHRDHIGDDPRDLGLQLHSMSWSPAAVTRASPSAHPAVR